MHAWQEWLLVLGVWLTLALVLGGGAIALWRRLSTPHLLPPWRPRRPAPWGGLEVLLLFLLLVLVWPGISWGLLKRYLGPADQSDQAWRQGLALLLAFPVQLASLVLVFRLRGFPLYRLGLHAGHWRTNLLLAYLVWFIVVPLTQTIQLGVEQLYFWDHGQAPPTHRFTQLVSGPANFWHWLVFTLVVLVVAPVIEEVLFRGLLQSWMQGHTYGGTFLLVLALMITLGHLFSSEENEGLGTIGNTDSLFEIALFVALISGGYFLCLWWFYRQLPWHRLLRASVPARTLPTTLPEDASHALAETPPDEGTLAPPTQALLPPEPAPATVEPQEDHLSPEKLRKIELAQAWPVMYGTAALWSAIHPWPTPFALFPLGLALSWLTYRTRSLLGPLAVHAGFNLVACLATALSTILDNG